MDKEVAALVLTVVVHLLGMAALIWALVLDDDDRRDWRGWFGSDDDGDHEPREPRPGPGGDGLPIPLPDAAPSAVRLREGGGRLADAHPRPARRPSHAPERAPQRERV